MAVVVVVVVRFFRLAMLQDHLLQHSGERAFQCATCGRRFPRQSALVKHERLHTAEPATRRCEVCHVEVSAGSMKGHMLIHSGSRPYNCQWCAAAYRRRDNLRVHCARMHGVRLPSLREIKVQRVNSPPDSKNCLFQRVNSADSNCLFAVNNQDADVLTLVASNETVVAH